MQINDKNKSLITSGSYLIKTTHLKLTELSV